jgi:hypothetical protein
MAVPVKRYPVMPDKCATCPFRDGSPHANLSGYLATSALNEASRVCHSTATSAIKGRTGKPAMLCRGARDVQLGYFAGIGFITAPTDEAWEAKCRELDLK